MSSISLSLHRRCSTFCVLIFVSLCAAIIFWANGNPRARARSLGYIDRDANLLGFRPTRVLAHAPGYTFFENVYWQDGMFKIYTEDPWSVPDVHDIARHNTDDQKGEIQDVEIIHVLDKPWSPDNDPKWLRFSHILLDEVRFLTESAVHIDGLTFGTADREFIDHYYHFVELFLPMWKLLQKAKERHPFNTISTTVENVAFFNADSERIDTPGTPPAHRWQDRAGVNKILIENAFPGAAITTKDEWIPRARAGTLYRFSNLLLASRRAGHGGPNSAHKPFGDILRLPVGSDGWWDTIRAQILSKHKSDFPKPSASRPVITYLSRQSTGRRLTDQGHLDLIEELQAIAKTGKAEYRMEEFEDVPVPEQWARLARTTIFVGVHGNGLTHIIFMPGFPGSAVYEMQPVKCQINDYAPFAQFRNIPHFLVRNSNMCTPDECENRGCHDGGNIGSHDIPVDARMLGNSIRSRLGIEPRL